jgi:DNA-binding NarL/FixJ family response regulator
MDIIQLKEETLSARELEVLELIAQGHKDRKVAFVLEIEECTVRFHVRNILGKLEVKSRAAAVYYAFKKGWIS